MYASSVVALEPKTLKVKDWFTAPGADFNATPVVFRHNNKDLVVATGNDGRLYVLDGSSLGGSDHKTALHVTGRYTRPGVTAGVSTWEDQGTRWILAPVDGPPSPTLPAERDRAALASAVRPNSALPGELGSAADPRNRTGAGLAPSRGRPAPSSPSSSPSRAARSHWNARGPPEPWSLH